MAPRLELGFRVPVASFVRVVRLLRLHVWQHQASSVQLAVGLRRASLVLKDFSAQAQPTTKSYVCRHRADTAKRVQRNRAVARCLLASTPPTKWEISFLALRSLAFSAHQARLAPKVSSAQLASSVWVVRKTRLSAQPRLGSFALQEQPPGRVSSACTANSALAELRLPGTASARLASSVQKGARSQMAYLVPRGLSVLAAWPTHSIATVTLGPHVLWARHPKRDNCVLLDSSARVAPRCRCRALPHLVS